MKPQTQSNPSNTTRPLVKVLVDVLRILREEYRALEFKYQESVQEETIARNQYDELRDPSFHEWNNNTQELAALADKRLGGFQKSQINLRWCMEQKKTEGKLLFKFVGQTGPKCKFTIPEQKICLEKICEVLVNRERP